MPVCDVLIRANEGQGACNFKLWHDLLGKGSEGAVAREFKFSDIVTLSHHGERRASLSSGPSNREILDMVAYGCDVGEQLESVVQSPSLPMRSSMRRRLVNRID
ncbi:hypothetical protein AAC387_Pa01g2362 [Persea americana]